MPIEISTLKYEELDAFETDLLGRKDFAEALTNLVTTNNDPLVVSLESQWGEGKTVFIHQWRHLLKKREIPAIYFDAFKADFHSEAFLSLSVELYKFAQQQEPSEGNKAKAVKEGLVQVGKILTKSAFKTGMSFLPMGSELHGAAQNFVQDVAQRLTETGEEMFEQAFIEQVELDAALEKFQNTLSNLTRSTPGDRPLVFIIDELDRCRPDFALELLEKVKHVFSVQGIKFVLVNNPKQLEESVRATYGAKMDANRYLHKFFDFSLSLPTRKSSNVGEPDDISAYVNHLVPKLGKHIPEGGDSAKAIIAIAVHKRLTLRDIDRVSGWFSTYYFFCPHSALRDSLQIIVVALCVLKVLDSGLFDKVLSEEADQHDWADFLLEKRAPDSKSFMVRVSDLVRCLYSDSIAEYQGGGGRTAMESCQQALGVFDIADKRKLRKELLKPFRFIT